MARVPVFVEVVSSQQHANVQICRKIMTILFKEKIAPLPFASNAIEVKDVLSALQGRGLTPAVFVINTFYAEELLGQVDMLVGQTPVVFLRRQLFSESMFAKAGAPAAHSVTQVLDSLTPRLSTEWTYGAQTACEVAAKAAKVLIEFLKEGKFDILEDFSQGQALASLNSRMESSSGSHRSSQSISRT
ncbi:MAG: hypothetical protein NTW87_06655 [Planctomycetota bacterium]|nr:hypothetical protein [Planctomycetota bacterium]